MEQGSSLRRNPLSVDPMSGGSGPVEMPTMATPHPDHLAPKNDQGKDAVSGPPKIEGAKGFGGA